VGAFSTVPGVGHAMEARHSPLPLHCGAVRGRRSGSPGGVTTTGVLPFWRWFELLVLVLVSTTSSAPFLPARTLVLIFMVLSFG
jgi:hypothetical protein